MGTKINKNNEIKIRVRDEFKQNYLYFCKVNGYVMSKRIRTLIENDMKKGNPDG